MSDRTAKVSRRDLRRAFGNNASELLAAHHEVLENVIGVVFGRGFWGRILWLLRGK